MNTFSNTRLSWTNAATDHAESRGYSRSYIEAIARNPLGVVEQAAGRCVVSGYGYGVVLSKSNKGRGYYIVTVFRTDGEATHKATDVA